MLELVISQVLLHADQLLVTVQLRQFPAVHTLSWPSPIDPAFAAALREEHCLRTVVLVPDDFDEWGAEDQRILVSQGLRRARYRQGRPTAWGSSSPLRTTRQRR